ncbi:SIMPL domain-containing protein [Natronomonas sp. F2-12]|jgi:uncharacterized protein YggE|uniref:SIMPL domain-containing protein n=1 Tax=Natronomonas aquatica TaxID=2841590 RepID=A0A9R1CTA3_9EURY|nr:SIMPL domain-containing protein [Natronomonas aquatica]MCQ4333540.1 SIMPL domain-containing protein [Natronomonas aquatica]
MQRERLAVLVIVVSLFALTLVGAAIVSPIGADAPADGADRSITVSAVGGADAAPDRAVVRVAATAAGDDPAAVRDELTADADALRSALESAGITEDDYETVSYRIDEPRRPREPGAEDETPAYRGVHAFEITLDDPDRTGAVVDAAADSDAEINDIRFTLSEERRNELREEAIGDAMGDARTQADTIADNGELSVTGVHRVDAAQRNFRPVRHEAAAGDGGAPPDTAIESGDVSVQYQVTVTYNATAGTP